MSRADAPLALHLLYNLSAHPPLRRFISDDSYQTIHIRRFMSDDSYQTMRPCDSRTEPTPPGMSLVITSGVLVARALPSMPFSAMTSHTHTSSGLRGGLHISMEATSLCISGLR